MRRTRTMTLTVAAGALLLGLTTVSATAQTPVMPHHAPVTARPSVSTLPPLTVSATTVKAGQVVTVSGAACAPQTASGPGAVEVDLTTASGTLLSSAYVSAISSNSTWSTPITVAASTKAGSYLLAATCDEYTTSTSYTPVGITVTATTVTTWTVQQPAFQPVPNGSFAGISCPHGTTTWCMAVGNYDNAAGTQVPLTSIWNGTAWTPTALTPPAGATSSGLTSVSCTSSTQCVAVGTYQPSSGQTGTLSVVYSWNGSTWKSATLTVPTTSYSVTANGVSCATSSYCVIVGDDDTTPNWVGISWVGSGTSWKSHSIASSDSSELTELNAVQCLSTTWCVAVGDYYDNDIDDAALAQVWNGKSWTNKAIPYQGYDAPLNAVSCMTTSTCTAAGGMDFDTPVIATLAGGTWNETQIAGSTQGGLTTVACPTSGQCIAGGESESDSYNIRTAISYRQNSTGWSPVSVPSTGSDNQLSAIACPTATTCVGVGSNDLDTLSASWNGSSWSTVARNDPNGAPSAWLTGVSCPSSTSCIAVGSQASSVGSNGQDTTTAVVTTYNGSAWAPVSLALPQGTTASELNAISCPTTSTCFAVGDYTVGTTQKPLLATDSSGTWSAAAFAISSTDHTNVLDSISCVSTAYCLAMGYSNTSGVDRSYTWNGATWTAKNLPSNFSESSVACPAVKTCLAVGGISTSDEGDVPSSASWNGTSWTVRSYPSSAAAFADGIFCLTSTSCVAVGDSEPDVDEGDAASDIWNGKQWSAVTAPDPSPDESYLNSVFCTKSTSCTAVGMTDGITPLIETWNGSSWSQLNLPAAILNLDDPLQSLSCAPGTTTCIAVGGGVALRSGS